MEEQSVLEEKKDPLAALRFREFRSFIGMRFFFTFAYQMQAIVLGLYIYDLTRDPLALAFIGLTLVAQIYHGMTVDGLGFIVALIDAFALAAYFLMGEHGVKSRSSTSLTTYGFGVATLFWFFVLLFLGGFFTCLFFPFKR